MQNQKRRSGGALLCCAILLAGLAVWNPMRWTGRAAALSLGLQMASYLPALWAETDAPAPTQATTQTPAAPAAPVDATEPDDLTKTPDDIADKITAYAAAHKNDKKDGNIKERTYTKANATSSFQNILVRNTTASSSINSEKVLASPLDLQPIDKAKPVVLLFHTHTTEGYETLDRGWYAQDVSSRSTDPSVNIVRVGDEIAAQLKAAGYGVIHDTEIHDRRYTGAYDHSRASVEAYLEKYPSIQITLDIHRDAIQQSDGTKIKPVVTIDGKKAAQVMIIAGAQGGKVTEFPDWQYNLRFAVHLQKQVEDLFPGLMRPIMFCNRKYNMDVNHNSLLLEFGSDANTLDEAAYAGRIVGKALAALLEEYITT